MQEPEERQLGMFIGCLSRLKVESSARLGARGMQTLVAAKAGQREELDFRKISTKI